MEKLTAEEIKRLETIVKYLNDEDMKGISFKLIKTKGTYYIYPEFD